MRLEARQILKALRMLEMEELERVYTKSGELIRRRREQHEKSRTSTRKRETPEKRQQDGVTYRLQSVRCGKTGCHCITGRAHGPYWYAFWSEAGKARSRYIGKQFSAGEIQT